MAHRDGAGAPPGEEAAVFREIAGDLVLEAEIPLGDREADRGAGEALAEGVGDMPHPGAVGGEPPLCDHPAVPGEEQRVDVGLRRIGEGAVELCQRAAVHPLLLGRSPLQHKGGALPVRIGFRIRAIGQQPLGLLAEQQVSHQPQRAHLGAQCHQTPLQVKI